jgi:hypothetical protein
VVEECNYIESYRFSPERPRDKTNPLARRISLIIGKVVI